MRQQFAPKLLSLMLVASLWALPGAAQNADEQYELGQSALRQGNYSAAEKAFNAVLAGNAEQADAALYWLAYTYYQSGQERLAKKTLSRLRDNYPSSPWLDDAEALELQHGAPKTSAEIGTLEDQELRLYALAALMDKHPARALPLAQKMLNESRDDDVREQVLFIIGTSDQPEARQIIRDIAFKGASDDVRRGAIYLIADKANKADLEALYQLYSQLSDKDSKDSVLHALADQGQEAYVLKLLELEKDPDLQASAVYALGNMEQSTALQHLDLRKLHPEAQRAAVYMFADSSDTRPEQIDLLRQMYKESTDDDLKESILYALGNAEQGVILVEILKQEKTPDLQATAIYALSNMEAADALHQIDSAQLSAHGREALVHAFGQMGDLATLRKMLQEESMKGMRATIIYSMAEIDDDESAGSEVIPNLLQIYHQANSTSDEREAVIHALSQRNATSELLQLMRTETDKDTRNTILHALAESDDPAAQEYLFRLLEQ